MNHPLEGRSPLRLQHRTLIRIQLASGVLFVAFAALHLVNTAVAGLGAREYDAFQQAARLAYQNPAVEVGLILTPLIVHLGAAGLRWHREGWRRTAAWRMRLHRASGLYLMLVIAGHVAATRGPSLLLDFHPGSAGLSFSLWWLPWLFYPYYATFSIAGLYHVANGLILIGNHIGLPLPAVARRGPGFWVPFTFATGAIWLGILGLGGWLYEIPDPTDNATARMWEHMGVSLDRRDAGLSVSSFPLGLGPGIPGTAPGAGETQSTQPETEQGSRRGLRNDDHVEPFEREPKVRAEDLSHAALGSQHQTAGAHVRYVREDELEGKAAGIRDRGGRNRELQEELQGGDRSELYILTLESGRPMRMADQAEDHLSPPGDGRENESPECLR